MSSFFQVMLLLGAQNTTDPCKMVISMMLLQSKSVMHEINSGTCDNNLYSKNTEKPLKIWLITENEEIVKN